MVTAVLKAALVAPAASTSHHSEGVRRSWLQDWGRHTLINTTATA